MDPTTNAEGEDDAGNSSDEALCEMLGLKSLDTVIVDHVDDSQIQQPTSLTTIVKLHNLQLIYESESMCLFPKEVSVSPALMRRLTDELIWGGTEVKADRTYETIKVLKATGDIEDRRTLTRLENFVNHHEGWRELCHGHLADCISALCGEPMVLFKEKLNLKPRGGSGFAPHLDAPSLRIALRDEGPQIFVTVMVAIDDMTSSNGCLQICKGDWSEANHCEVVQPVEGENPDAAGRAGAIQPEVAQALPFVDVECNGGDILAFNGWAPHRSAANASPFPRRAVFLTYNPKSEGDFHDRYYQRMDEVRNSWRKNLEFGSIPQMELDALSTIPRI